MVQEQALEEELVDVGFEHFEELAEVVLLAVDGPAGLAVQVGDFAPALHHLLC